MNQNSRNNINVATEFKKKKLIKPVKPLNL